MTEPSKLWVAFTSFEGSLPAPVSTSAIALSLWFETTESNSTSAESQRKRIGSERVTESALLRLMRRRYLGGAMKTRPLQPLPDLLPGPA